MNQSTEEQRRALLELLEQARTETRAVLAPMDPEQLVHTDERAWRVRDVIGHLGVWNGEAARSLEAFVDGGEYICVGARGEYYDYNGIAAELRKAWTMEQLWAEYEATHDQLREAVAQIPAEKWDGEVIYPWNERGTVEGLVHIMLKHETTDHCALIARAVAT